MKAHIALILLCTLVLSGCSLNQQTAPSSTPTPMESETVNQVETASEQMVDAFASGNPLTCQVTSSTAGEAPSIYLIKGHKMKMISQANASGNQFFSINDGVTVYMWSTDTSVPAMKMDLATIQKSAGSFDNQLQSFPDLTDETERQKIADSGSTITCSETNIEDSEFIPPSDVTFRDFSEMMGNSVER